MPAQHNPDPSATLSKNQDTSSVPLYPSCIPGKDNPTHRSKSQKGILFLQKYPSSPVSNLQNPESADFHKHLTNQTVNTASIVPASHLHCW